jgi:glycine/D-amino acid oxidase-like deaminating enzyme
VYTVMARRSLRLWLDFFEKENQLDCFRETGVLWMAPASEGSIWEARKIFERLGIIHQWLDTNAIRTNTRSLRFQPARWRYMSPTPALFLRNVPCH